MVDRKKSLVLCVAILALSSCDSGTQGGPFLPPPPVPGEEAAFPFPEHVDQFQIRDGLLNFDILFDQGDELFEVRYNAFDGIGILKLPDGTPLPGRFSRIPPGGGRTTGPNGDSCTACHNTPFGTAAGPNSSNVAQDPSQDGVGPFNIRNATSLFGSGVLQRLAEEMTEELHRQRDQALADLSPGDPEVRVALEANGVSFGLLGVAKNPDGSPRLDVDRLEGIDPDLVVRPYGWKGDVATLRDFTRGAASNELGLESDELVDKDPLGREDPDCDGVTGELSVGDITALVLYIGAQEIPQPRGRLVAAGLLPPPPPDQNRLALEGEILFEQIGCTSCHQPRLRLFDPVFEEPTLRGRGAYFDPEIDPLETGLDPLAPFRFHLVREGDFPRLVPHPNGGAIVELYGDLKRHNMGRTLADPQPTPVVGANGRPLTHEGTPVTVDGSLFLTAELWGVGDSGPWLHDGRASTLEDAILLHGEAEPAPPGDPGRSEAQESRDLFAALPEEQRIAVVEFLKSLIHFSLEGAEEE